MSQRLIAIALLLLSAGAWGRPGGDFTLTDHDQRSLSLRDFQGKVVVVAFGYTFCPDICPTALATINSALRELGEQADEVQPLFVSLDPQRDTPQRLKEYVHWFHPRMIGLTGDPDTLREVAGRYQVRYRFEGKGSRENYSLDHTASIYVIDRDGLLVRMLPHGLPASALARALKYFVLKPALRAKTDPTDRP